MEWLKQLLFARELEELQILRNSIRLLEETDQITKDTVKNLRVELNLKQEEISQLNKQIDLLKELEKKIPLEELKDYFLNKWKEGYVTFNYRGEGYEDIKTCLYESAEGYKAFDEIAESIIKRYSLASKKLDLIPWYVMVWREEKFAGNIYYANDLKTFGRRDYWQRGELTLKNYKNGFDCDDMMIVMHLVMRHILIRLNKADQLWRLKGCCSDTILGGHAYNIWLAEDIEWYVVETTMGVKETKDNWQKKPLRYNGLYSKIWFTFNKDHTWSDNDFVFDKEDFFKKKE